MLVKIKAFLFTALTAAIFVFAGCSSDSGGNDGGGKPAPSPEVQFAEDYASAVTSFIPGQKFQVQALVLNAESQTVSFSCSNSKVLKVEDNGSGYAYIYPLSEGSAKVTAKAVVNEEVYFAVQEFTVAFDTEKYVANEESALSSGSVSSSDHASTFAIESSFTDFTVHLFKEDSLEAVKLSSEKSIEVETAPSTTYTAKVYCSNAESYTYFEVPSWTTPADSIPPEKVTGVSASTEYDDKIKVTWINSVSTDVEKIVISWVENNAEVTAVPSEVVLTAEDIDLTPGASVTYSIEMEVRKTSSDYTFTLAAFDGAENKSEEVSAQGALVADITPCGEVSDLVFEIVSSTESDVTYTMSYNEPSEKDFDKVIIQNNAGDEISYNNGFTVSKDASIVVCTVDKVGNMSSGIAVTASYFESPSEFTMSADYSYSYIVKGFNSLESDCTYVLKAVKAGDENRAEIASEEFTSEASAVVLRDLEYKAEYNVSVEAVKQGENYTIKTVSQSKKGPAVEKVIWEIHNSWNGNGFITPYILSDDTVKGYNIVLAGNESTYYTDVSNFKYNAFIVYPAFNGNPEQFSLEATNLGTLEESGLFVRPAGTSFTTADYNNTGNQSSWGFSASVSLFAVAYDEANKDMYSFRKWAMNSVSAEVPSYALDNSWYGFACQGYADYNVWSSCANICMSNAWDKITKDDYYDGRYFIYEHRYNGEVSGTPEVIDSSVSNHTASVSYKLSAPDVIKVEVSLSGKDYEDNSIPTVEILSPRGTVCGSASFEKLKSGTAYTATVTQYTSDGATSCSTTEVTTETDETAPADVTNAVVQGGRSSISLSWTEPADTDFKCVKIVPYTVTTDSEGSKTSTATGEEFTVNKGTTYYVCTEVDAETEYEFKIYALDYDNNSSAGVTTDTCALGVPVAKNVTAKARWTQEVLVKWTDVSMVEVDSNGETVTYTYNVAVKQGEEEVASKNVASGAGIAQFTGLTVGTEYTFTVSVIPSDTPDESFSNEDCVKTATPRKVTVVYKNNGESSNPYLTASSGKEPITNSGSSKGFTTSWIVWPALDGSIEFTYTLDSSTDSNAVKPQTGTVDTFSLEATPNSGYESGLYLNFPSLGTSNTSATSLTDVIKAPDEEMDYSKATFFNGTTKCGSSYPYVIRPVFNDGKIQIGASSKVIQYRNSEGSPGVAMWAWSATYSYSTDAE